MPAEMMLRAASALRASAATSATRRTAAATTRRCYGSGAGETFEGVTIHEPEAWQLRLANGVSALMWFWILVRARHDGEDLIYGHVRHFKDDHGHH